jgi:predicted Zn-dependent peptidase
LAWTQWAGQAGDGHGHVHGETAAHTQDLQSKLSEQSTTRIMTVTLTDDMRFTPANWQATSGETVRIQLVNAGKVRHEFIIGTEAELQAAKSNLVGGFALRLDTNRKLLDNVASLAWNDLPLNYLDTWTQQVQRVTRADIRKAFQRVLQPERMVTVVVGGKP